MLVAAGAVVELCGTVLAVAVEAGTEVAEGSELGTVLVVGAAGIVVELETELLLGAVVVLLGAVVGSWLTGMDDELVELGTLVVDGEADVLRDEAVVEAAVVVVVGAGAVVELGAAVVELVPVVEAVPSLVPGTAVELEVAGSALVELVVAAVVVVAALAGAAGAHIRVTQAKSHAIIPRLVRRGLRFGSQVRTANLTPLLVEHGQTRAEQSYPGVSARRRCVGFPASWHVRAGTSGCCGRATGLT